MPTVAPIVEPTITYESDEDDDEPTITTGGRTAKAPTISDADPVGSAMTATASSPTLPRDTTVTPDSGQVSCSPAPPPHATTITYGETDAGSALSCTARDRRVVGHRHRLCDGHQLGPVMGTVTITPGVQRRHWCAADRCRRRADHHLYRRCHQLDTRSPSMIPMTTPPTSHRHWQPRAHRHRDHHTRSAHTHLYGCI